MYRSKWGFLFAGLAALALLGLACSSDDNSTNSGTDPGGSADGTHLIAAEIGAAVVTGGQFMALVERMDAGAPGADDLTFSLNGETLNASLGSYDDSAVYAKLNFGYTKGASYTINVSSGSKSSSCSFTGPNYAYPTIREPADGSSFTLGQDIDVSWVYDSDNPPDQVYLKVMPNGSEESVIYEQTISGSRSHTIPGSVTAGHSEYTSLVITVDGGEIAFPFDGDLAYTGSNVVTVLPGDAIEITPGQPDTYSVALDPYATSLVADGVSSTTLVATVWNETQSMAVQSPTVSFTVEPHDALIIDPNPCSAPEGSAECHVTVTAGLVTGTATVTATYQGTDSDPLSYTLSEQFVVTLSDAEFPEISWPSSYTASGIVVSSVGQGADVIAWSISSLTSPGIQSPITYGTKPAGASQLWPAGGATPAPLAEGHDYRITFALDGGGTETWTFTR